MMRSPICVVLLFACGSKEAPPPKPSPAPVAHATPDAATLDAATLDAATPDAAAFAMPDEPSWAKDPPDVLRAKINAVNAHIVVLKSTDFLDYRDVLKTVERTDGVLAAEAFIFAELQIAKQGGVPIPFAIKAVDPKRVEKVLAIGPRMKTGTFGSLADAKPSIILGDDLARKLGAQLGDSVTVSQLAAPTPIQAGDPPAVYPGVFRVTGTFHMDFDEYDEKLAFVPLAAMQKMLARGDQVMGIEMTVTDLAKSGELAKAIETKLGGPPYQAMDWYELNEQLFVALGHRRP